MGHKAFREKPPNSGSRLRLPKSSDAFDGTVLEARLVIRILGMMRGNGVRADLAPLRAASNERRIGLD